MAPWDELLGILKSAREERAENDAEPPVACPVHGDPLEAARGVLHCPMGHVVDPDSNRY